MQQTGRACFLQAIEGLCESLHGRLAKILPEEMAQAQEIRLLCGAPPMINLAGHPHVIAGQAVTQDELTQSVVTLCGRSVHTHQRELTRGFLSLPGGHRAGIAATAVYNEAGTLQSAREVTAIVIRVAHDHLGISRPLISQLFPDGLGGLLVAGAPGSGKTTLLRDLARELSHGALTGCYAVAVVDERCELSRGLEGCCVLSRYDKGDGILLAVRSLAPQVVICDEIGSKQDVDAVRWALGCGVSVVASIHARSARELCSRKAGRALLDSGAFERIVFLSDIPCPCTVKEVIRTDELASILRDCDARVELCAGRGVDRPGISKTDS